jgi:flagellar basal-body rod protein FlgF
METGAANAIFQMTTGQSDRLDACTENLANSMMPGYRRIIATQGKFDAYLKAANKSSNMVVDFTPGPYHVTDKPFDMAVNGKGFFVLSKDGSEYYTRNGNFSRAPDGSLINSGGLTVLGESGPIKIPTNTDLTHLTVDADRTLRAGNKPLARLRLVAFDNTDALQRAGPTLFAAPSGVQAQNDTKSTVSNRTLEGSNTSIFEELSEMVSCTRAQESCQRMIRTQDQIESKAISTFAR